ncbi:MAG: hypothetical protein KatS3mg087_1424 [Patescibacteria group bacterium]|nr:MAG: hypothetical protein KatS3mg087_1424 [Patescibacteria group bacterium]
MEVMPKKKYANEPESEPLYQPSSRERERWNSVHNVKEAVDGDKKEGLPVAGKK